MSRPNFVRGIELTRSGSIGPRAASASGPVRANSLPVPAATRPSGPGVSPLRPRGRRRRRPSLAGRSIPGAPPRRRCAPNAGHRGPRLGNKPLVRRLDRQKRDQAAGAGVVRVEPHREPSMSDLDVRHRRARSQTQTRVRIDAGHGFTTPNVRMTGLQDREGALHVRVHVAAEQVAARGQGGHVVNHFVRSREGLIVEDLL